MSNLYVPKPDNQYFGSFFEQCICDKINGTMDAYVDYPFTQEDIQCMYHDAGIAASYLMNYFSNNGFYITEAVHVGRQTANADCDIILYDENGNEQHLEVKYVGGGGTGTFYNGSANRVASEMYFMEYSDYLRESGYYDDLESIIAPYDLHVNFNNASPVSKDISHVIRRELPSEVYDTIQDVENAYRVEYVRQFGNYIVQEGLETVLLELLINKDASISDAKGTPDFLFAFTRETESCSILTSQQIRQHAPHTQMQQNDLGFIFDGKYRAQWGWQNGNGLSNPTVRMFLM